MIYLVISKKIAIAIIDGYRWLSLIRLSFGEHLDDTHRRMFRVKHSCA